MPIDPLCPFWKFDSTLSPEVVTHFLYRKYENIGNNNNNNNNNNNISPLVSIVVANRECPWMGLSAVSVQPARGGIGTPDIIIPGLIPYRLGCIGTQSYVCLSVLSPDLGALEPKVLSVCLSVCG